ncbi:NUDIX hydrolase [Candidatus Bipolaricaulota bacterium]|nr:NUDIX hydrolase [Candidatus Bipolaricaulota bacterium]
MNISGEEENLDGETLEENQIFQGKLLRLTVNTVRDSDGSITEREVVHHPGGVVILPILNGDQGEEILLVKQYREPAGEALWELPAGTLEEGESQRECALRELMEETRYRPAGLEKKVNLFTSPGYSDEILTLYQATGLEKISDSEVVESPEGENLTAKSFPVQEIITKAREGKITDGKTLAGLFFLFDQTINS